ncbi:MAG: bifunctional diaminohydroxyphosphoribosylaminopyrimidine deaminase/5-amino-6-(5-phosphoribosylamino)uracil reductase RibD, partial [Planctomycetes bacterium]|nr:bifunctional diaminohydroxyphosphoribosylaminopyrimidine deaminase/5-amino-6-(5-phosphoribosylamino)uracil reductase RibD [Planctomycetota bacterium]
MAESLTEKDRIFLLLAAEEAWKGQGSVEPNPMVGALIVREGEIAARGVHRRYGGPHAEVAVLKKAGDAARGATLYVTLEPCSSQGKTPPCTEAVQRAGVRRVVVGAVDPNPAHGGAGLRILRDAGLTVDLLEEDACAALLDPFKTYLAGDRPYVILKWAMTLDGRIASRTGNSRWISGESSRRAVHELRGHVDGVMVGRRTMELDDPHLNCRWRRAPLVPVRIVLDPMLRGPMTAGLYQGANQTADASGFPQGPVWVYARKGAPAEQVERLRRNQVNVAFLSAPGENRAAFLREALVALRRQGIHRLLVEGGAALFAAFIEARLADQVE